MLIQHLKTYESYRGMHTVKCQPSLSTFDCFTFTVLVTVVTKPMPHPTVTIAAAVAGRSCQATHVWCPATWRIIWSHIDEFIQDRSSNTAFRRLETTYRGALETAVAGRILAAAALVLALRTVGT